MKCPKCGEEMPEGSLYCEHCGEDIHIVPDFEPELERSIEQSISGIVAELHQEDQRQGVALPGSGDSIVRRRKTGQSDVRRSRKRQKWKLVLILGMVVMISAGAAWGVYSYNSWEYQAGRGAHYAALARYDRAVSCYSRALALDSGNIELMFSLADVYYQKNNKIEYEYLLREIARSADASTEQLERAYNRLIAVYRDRGDYGTINELLLASSNEQIRSTYRSYMAQVPEFSMKEGYYKGIQPLKLTAFGTGKIYYTLDGTEPTENSIPYTAPVILENGDYVVTAFFLNDKGISSEIVSKEYHIENDEIPAPEISAISGEYRFPVNIEASGEAGEIYYTTDGSDPTYSSRVYTGPIPMPLGRSSYKFAQIVNGVTGIVAERSYQLELDTRYGPEEAAAIIAGHFLSVGKVYDEEGHFDESGAAYLYEYQYVTSVDEESIYFVISEILRSAGGERERTGSSYAVNAQTGEYFRLEQDKKGRYTLNAMEKREAEDIENKDSENKDSENEE